MNTELADLRDAVRGLIARGGGWQQLCAQIGVAGLAIPERYGGHGAGAAETGIVMSELGRELVSSPMLGSSVLAAQALLATGDQSACERLLPGIADGSRVAALAWDPAFSFADGAISGRARFVLDGASADVLLAATDAGLFEVDVAAAKRIAVPAMDSTRELAEIWLDGAAGVSIGGPDASAALAAARDQGLIALAAEATGAAERALEITLDYARTRVQFGRPIGSFQALQHRIADMHVLVESARSCWLAAAREGRPMLAAAARVYCGQALTAVAGEMVQLHGAIGVTWEHSAHRYLKRAHGVSSLLGSPEAHVARVAAEWPFHDRV
jgi:alkylation response protein AidB-like acyl-CoA dehydrogenase